MYRFPGLRTKGSQLAVLIFFITSHFLFAQQGKISGIIKEAQTSEPMPMVTVWLVNTEFAAMSEIDGTFELSVPEGNYEIRVNMPGFKPVIERVSVKSDQLINKVFALEYQMGGDELAVIGTRGEERTISSSPVPIDIISEEEIKKSGLHETAEILHRFVPSVNYPRPAITDGTDHTPPFTLRGLGSDQVLVLVNGKRHHNTALVHINSSIGRGSTSVDVNTIPVTAIKRIEVLRDGAAAQYGSDAIAGIVNIVLKDDTQSEISTKYQTTAEGDGNAVQFSNSFGINIGQSGILNITAEFRDKGYTNRALSSQGLSGIDNPLNGNRTLRQGEAKSRDLSLAANGSIPLSETTSLYATALYNMRNGEGPGYYRFPSQSRTLVALYPNGFLPLITPKITDGFFIGGIKTKISDWTVDLSTTYGVNTFEFNVSNSVNSSFGPTSQKSFYCGTLAFRQSTTNIDLFRTVSLGLEEPLSIGIGAELRIENFMISKGEENSYLSGTYRDTVYLPGGIKQFRIYPGGAQVFPGFQPSNETDKSRNNVALYVDLEQKLLKNILLGVAGRYENFSDFGQTANGKFSLRYEPVENIFFRASTSTGFRAPSLAQSYFTSTATNTINGVPYQIGTLSVEHPLAKQLGAAPLEPEKSFHLSGGVVLQKIRNLTLSADYFYVNLKDRIVFSGNFTTSNSSYQIKKLLNQYQIGGARFFTNAVDTKTSGIDLQAKYNLNLKELGLVMLSMGANLNSTKIEDINYPSQIAKTDTAKKIFFDEIEKSRTETQQPRVTIMGQINYQLNNLSVFLRAERYGDIEVVFDALNASKKQKFDARILTDLDISYRLFDIFTLSVGGHNIFDVYPEATEAAYLPAKPNDAVIYNPSSPFSFSGADYYVRISYGL